MTVNEKLSKSLDAVTVYLRDSLQALDKKDENSFANSLWHAAAELEYALFMFSMKFQDEGIASKWKPNPELKKAETAELMAEAQSLLTEAEESVGNEKLLEAYRSAYVARHYLLRVQEDLAKKKRQALKKK